VCLKHTDQDAMVRPQKGVERARQKKTERRGYTVQPPSIIWNKNGRCCELPWPVRFPDVVRATTKAESRGALGACVDGVPRGFGVRYGRCRGGGGGGGGCRREACGSDVVPGKHGGVERERRRKRRKRRDLEKGREGTESWICRMVAPGRRLAFGWVEGGWDGTRRSGYRRRRRTCCR
jgi:hypothetical protein